MSYRKVAMIFLSAMAIGKGCSYQMDGDINHFHFLNYHIASDKDCDEIAKHNDLDKSKTG